MIWINNCDQFRQSFICTLYSQKVITVSKICVKTLLDRLSILRHLLLDVSYSITYLVWVSTFYYGLKRCAAILDWFLRAAIFLGSILYPPISLGQVSQFNCRPLGPFWWRQFSCGKKGTWSHFSEALRPEQQNLHETRNSRYICTWTLRPCHKIEYI